ncbi:hypothetical protein WOLCODRAFT_162007 [Wolfiporia cocos MD-104 SS10]|uniref:Methyltransferase domain-containing protein n=1 Tax=Wolfiporia cocos (strain MD-104) TaxID=742152 RepID=A0A2H3JQG8_WOLCO|nr:hypothetical protein WOLCODRAFT_162007 [Wolfiporia cocos MD-104 SS10]
MAMLLPTAGGARRRTGLMSPQPRNNTHRDEPRVPLPFIDSTNPTRPSIDTITPKPLESGPLSAPLAHSRSKFLSMRRSTSAAAVPQIKRNAHAARLESHDVPERVSSAPPHGESLMRPSFSSTTPNSAPMKTPRRSTTVERWEPVSSEDIIDRLPSLGISDGTNTMSLEQWEGAQHDSEHAAAEEADLDQLRELSKKMQARESQFMVKNGKRHHSFPNKHVPYPRSYDREVIDHDVWCSMWSLQLSSNLAWHIFQTPPQKVLDIGCGTGSWIMNAALKWKDTRFVGLDVVPLYPELEHVDPDLASRIEWVQCNFLEGLPFADGEFDFVFIRRIARGVPEDKWDGLFEELVRVLKPGSVFQMSEEDLFFPGVQHDLSPPATQPEPSPFKSAPSSRLASPSRRPRAPTPDSIPSARGESSSSTHHLQSPGGSLLTNPSALRTAEDLLPFHSPTNPPPNVRDHSMLEFIYNEMHAARFINLQPLSILNNLIPLHFSRVRTHPPLITTFPPPPRRARAPASARQSRDHGSHEQHVSNLTGLGQACAAQLLQEHAAASPSHEMISERIRRLDLALLHPEGESPYVGVPEIIAGTRMYVRTDLGRYTAHAPASVFQPNDYQTKDDVHHPASSPSTPGGAPHHTIAALGPVEERLPIDAIQFDMRTLNLHLSVQVQEVLACAESMWDFVVEFQNTHGEEEELRIQERARRRLSRSHGEVAGALAAISRESSMRTRLLHLTRADFDMMLMNYKLDMQDCLGFNAILQDRLGWDPGFPSITDERKEFDSMCHVWEQFHNSLRAGSQHSLDQPNSCAVSFVSSHDSHDDQSECSDHHSAVNGEDYARGRKSGRHTGSQRTPSRFDGHPSTPQRPPFVAPYERLSRTIRLFTAIRP